MKRMMKTATRGASVLACLSLSVVSSCESSQPVKTAERGPAATAALAELPADQRARAEYLLRNPSRIETGLVYFIDGERFVPDHAPDSPYEVINPDLIASIELLRGADAEAKAGPGTAAGVVWITTRARADGDSIR